MEERKEAFLISAAISCMRKDFETIMVMESKR
jgi:hypothetical protein